MRAALAVAGLLALGLGLPATAALAEPPAAAPTLAAPPDVTQAPQGSAIVVRFNGGEVGENLAAALDAMRAEGVEIPTREARIPKNGTICGLLVRLNYPPPCTQFLPLVRALNGRSIDKEIVHEGDVVQIPDVELAAERRVRVFAGASEHKTWLYAAKNWRRLNPVPETRPNGDVVVRYDGYKLTVRARSDDEALRASARVRLVGDNMSAASVLTVTPSASLFSTADGLSDDQRAAKIEQECRDMAFTADRPYAHWASADSSAKRHADALRGKKEPVTLVLIDTPLVAAPNLQVPDLAPGAPRPQWACEARLPARKDHATYLAGIAASRRNGNGLEGVADNVRLESFSWEQLEGEALKPDPKAGTKLAERLTVDFDAPPPLKVYLAALGMPIWEGVANYGPGLRNKKPPADAIDDTDRLLIVAAGQSDGGAQEISASSRLSPQNLGDLHNVVVVTACLRCTEPDVTLLPTAHYSSGENRFVHLAAPGGPRMPGWLGGKSLGFDAGTSPAAAYVAATAAAMIGAYSKYYTDARRVKERLQTSSRPLPRLTRTGELNPDAEKLATGILDPYVALFDPNKHYIKQNGAWKDHKIKALTVTLTDEREKVVLSGSNWLRHLHATPEPGSPDAFTATIRARWDPAVPQGDVATLYNVRPNSLSGVELCDETTIPLAAVQNLFLAASGWHGDECGS